jgi:SAM-dependent methyltransferase
MWPTEQNRQAWDRRYGGSGDGYAGLPDAVRERLPELRGKHVLHLPSGTGEVAAELIELGALVTGVDADERALAVARERAPDAAFFQAEPHELPLQFRRGRFDLVYAGEGTLAAVADLAPFVSGLAAALRRKGRLLLHDWHPVAACVDPVDLRWRESYFDDNLRRLGEIVVAVIGTGLELHELAELPPPATEGGGRLDPRIPTTFLLIATQGERALPAPRRRGKQA